MTEIHFRRKKTFWLADNSSTNLNSTSDPFFPTSTIAQNHLSVQNPMNGHDSSILQHHLSVLNLPPTTPLTGFPYKEISPTMQTFASLQNSNYWDTCGGPLGLVAGVLAAARKESDGGDSSRGVKLVETICDVTGCSLFDSYAEMKEKERQKKQKTMEAENNKDGVSSSSQESSLCRLSSHRTSRKLMTSPPTKKTKRPYNVGKGMTSVGRFRPVIKRKSSFYKEREILAEMDAILAERVSLSKLDRFRTESSADDVSEGRTDSVRISGSRKVAKIGSENIEVEKLETAKFGAGLGHDSGRTSDFLGRECAPGFGGISTKSSNFEHFQGGFSAYQNINPKTDEWMNSKEVIIRQKCGGNPIPSKTTEEEGGMTSFDRCGGALDDSTLFFNNGFGRNGSPTTMNGLEEIGSQDWRERVENSSSKSLFGLSSGGRLDLELRL